MVDPTAINEANLSFIEILNPVNGSAEETLRFIMQKTGDANFDFDIFSLLERLPNGKNPSGLNGCIAAALDFFYQLGYFKKEYGLEQILKLILSTRVIPSEN